MNELLGLTNISTLHQPRKISNYRMLKMELLDGDGFPEVSGW
jgi:hypothetical protein